MTKTLEREDQVVHTDQKRIDHLFIASEGKYHKVQIEDILWVASEGNYAHIHSRAKRYVVRISLSNLLKLLPSDMFTKVHKCFIVQVGAIESLDRTNSELVIAQNTIPIGRSYKSSLLVGLNLIG